MGVHARFVLLLLMVGCTPVLQAGSCAAPPQGFGSAWWSSYKAWCRSCGGTIDDIYNTAQANGGCRMPSGGGSSGSSDAASTGAEIGQMIGNAIVDGIKAANERAKQQAAEYARLMAEQARLQAIADEERKQRLLGAMLDVEAPPRVSPIDDGGNDSGGLGLMLGDEPVARSSTGSAFMPTHNPRPQLNPQPGAVLKQPQPLPAATLADQMLLGDAPVPGNRPPPPAPPPEPDPTRDDVAFNKGFVAGSQCYSASAGAHCSGATGNVHALCISSYEAGYREGDAIKRVLLVQAQQAGELDAAQGRANAGFTHPLAQGPCRSQWLETYNSGYRNVPMPRMGR